MWDRSAPLAAIQAKTSAHVEYNEGTDAAAAAALAKRSEVAIVFVNQWTAENSDIPSLSLPDNQDALVSAVAAANPNTIVVVESGGPITMPWAKNVRGILEVWFPGIRGGEAIANLLFGDVNPSGKLPLTFPESEVAITPPRTRAPAAFTRTPPTWSNSFRASRFKQNGRHFDVNYSEGLEVGYKWYEAQHKQPLFPFGFGLSYTSYSYSGLKVTPGERPQVTFLRQEHGQARRPRDRAKCTPNCRRAQASRSIVSIAWQNVSLQPGESKQVSLAIDPEFLSIFDEAKDGWQLVPGSYRISAGPSSVELPLKAEVQLGQ